MKQLVNKTMNQSISKDYLSTVGSKNEKKPPTPMKKLEKRGPDGIVLFGNLADLGMLPHRKLLSMTKTYGHVISLKLGGWKTEVVNGYNACKDVFLKQSKSSSSRPFFRSYKHYSHGKSLSFQPYNEVWQVQRKILSRIINQMISKGFVAELAHRQTDALVQKWSQNQESFDPMIDLAETVSTFIYSFCYGKDEFLQNHEAFKNILFNHNPGTDLFAMGNNLDLLPFFLRPLLKHKEDEHIVRMNNLMNCHFEMRDKVEKNFSKNMHLDPTCLQEALFLEMENMFEVDKNECFLEEGSKLHRDHLINLPSEFLSAGSETSTASMLWLLWYMAKNQNVQEIVHNEIDNYLTEKKKSDPNAAAVIDFEDRMHLPYTEACRIEGLRCFAVVPFGLPHYPSKEFKAHNVTFFNDTLLFPNLWSIGRDPAVWSEPQRFIPERHLKFNNDTNAEDKITSDTLISKCPFSKVFNSQNPHQVNCPINATVSKEEKFFPFGMGKRRCIGEPMAKILNFIIFANIMLNFKIKLDSDSKTVKKTHKDIHKNAVLYKDNYLLRSFYKLIENSWTLAMKLIFGKTQAEYKVEYEENDENGNDDVVEQFGDVVKPCGYKIILEKRHF